MFKPNTPPPPKKTDFPKPESKDMEKDVMEAVERKGKPKQPESVEKAKNDLRRIIKQVGIDPQRIVKAGQMAERALKDPKMYQVAIQMAIKENLISEKDVQPGVIDYAILGKGLTAGRLTQELIDEGLV
jgi:hypothetical protein